MKIKQLPRVCSLTKSLLLNDKVNGMNEQRLVDSVYIKKNHRSFHAFRTRAAA